MKVENEKLNLVAGAQLSTSPVIGETVIATDSAGTLGFAGWPTYVGSGAPTGTPTGAHAFYVDTSASPPVFYVWA